MTDPAVAIPWDALEALAEAIGIRNGIMLEMRPPLGFDDSQPWRLQGPPGSPLPKDGVAAFMLFWLNAFAPGSPARQALETLLDALPPPPRSAAQRVQAMLLPGHAILRIEHAGGTSVPLIRPRPGAIRQAHRPTIHHLRPDAAPAFARWAKRSPDGLDVETDVGSRHERLAALAALPKALRDLADLWPEETRPRIRLRTWPGIAALLLVRGDGSDRIEHPVLLARRDPR